jgi:NAD(P)H dehydrogenase (quinone)
MIVVTGAGGHLGRLVVEGLLDTVPAGEIVAATRRPDSLADLATRGVQIRHADFAEPETLTSAFAGADKLLLISADTPGIRVGQHKAAVEAAASVGVGFIAYTSVLHANVSPLIVAPDHRATEETIVASGLPYAFLRNGWYVENYEQTVRAALNSGVIVGSAGDGRVATATRADYAAGAVAVLTARGSQNTLYELAGDTSWSFPEFAAELGKLAGREISYRNVTPEEHRAALTEAGLPEQTADVILSFDRDIAAGALGDTNGQLGKLIGRPTTPLAEWLRTQLP